MGQDGLRGLQKSCRKAAEKDSPDFTPPSPSPCRASLVLSNAKDFPFSSCPLQQGRGSPCPGAWQAQGWPCLGSAHPTRTKALPELPSNHKTTFPSPKTGGSAQHGAQLDGWLSKGPRTAGYPLPPSLQRAGLRAGGAEPRLGEGGGAVSRTPSPPGTPLPSPVPHTGRARSRRGFRMPRHAGGAPALFGLSCARQPHANASWSTGLRQKLCFAPATHGAGLPAKRQTILCCLRENGRARIKARGKWETERPPSPPVLTAVTAPGGIGAGLEGDANQVSPPAALSGAMPSSSSQDPAPKGCRSSSAHSPAFRAISCLS